MDEFRYRCLGLELRSGFALPGMHETDPDRAGQALELRLAGDHELVQAWSGPADKPPMESIFDGQPFRLDAGRDGDWLYTYGDRARFHLSPELDTLLCCPVSRTEAGWQRLMLDTVLVSVSFFRGFEALHASAVEVAGGVVAFVAVSGGGKTSLAAELARRGHPLFCDDVLVLSHGSNGVVAHPGPPVMNLPWERHAGDANEWIGEILGRFGDEAWVAVRNASTASKPVAAIYLVERGTGDDSGVAEAQNVTALTFLAHALRGLPARASSRFELFGDLVDSVPVRRLVVGPEDRPEALADRIERSLGVAPQTSLVAR